MTVGHPQLGGVVLDTTDARQLAEFYRQLLGYVYRPGDEPPPPGTPDIRGHDWLVLRDESGRTRLAFQQVVEMSPSTWPNPAVPQQLHLDCTVPTTGDLVDHRDRALMLGASILQDRFDDPNEPLYVFADPAGHPFCIYVPPEQPS